jgi:hypothetical protein
MSYYRILPYYLVNLFALALPYVEALFGLFLIFHVATPSAALGVTLLMTVFLGALISAVFRGIDTGCGCFSATAEPISLIQIFRDIVFLIMGIYVFVMALRRDAATQHRRTEMT